MSDPASFYKFSFEFLVLFETKSENSKSGLGRLFRASWCVWKALCRFSRQKYTTSFFIWNVGFMWDIVCCEILCGINVGLYV